MGTVQNVFLAFEEEEDTVREDFRLTAEEMAYILREPDAEEEPSDLPWHGLEDDNDIRAWCRQPERITPKHFYSFE